MANRRPSRLDRAPQPPAHPLRHLPRKLIITGTPQCMIPDYAMGKMIQNTKFDKIFVQYYNTPHCSARALADANADFSSTGVEAKSRFYSDWEDFIVGTASEDAELYIGLMGSAQAGGQEGGLLSLEETEKIVKAHLHRKNFGGIMIWDTTYATLNTVDGEPYYKAVRNAIDSFCPADKAAQICWGAKEMEVREEGSNDVWDNSCDMDETGCFDNVCTGLDYDELDCVNEDQQVEQDEEVKLDEAVTATTFAARTAPTSIVIKSTRTKTAGDETTSVRTSTPRKAVPPMVAHNSASDTFSPLVMAGALTLVATFFIVSL